MSSVRPSAFARLARRAPSRPCRPLERRRQSSSARLPPPPEISSWISDITGRPEETTTELLDEQRARHLQGTLPTRLGTGRSLGLRTSAMGDVLPKGHHMVYFQPQSLLSDLGEDGSSTEYNAPSPYLRRMWAGGSFHWSPNPDHLLRVGEPATQLNSVASAEFKNGMIFVNQQRDLYRGDGAVDKGKWAVREVRTHVFRREVSGNEAVKARAKKEAADTPRPTPSHTFTYTPTPPLLFRFSALTYNAHRIHYDRHWTQSVENHPDLVVHGPLTAALLVELAESVGREQGKELRGFEYRATSPMYVDKEIRLAAFDPEEGGEGEVRRGMVAEQDGRVGMRATAIYSRHV